MNQIKSNKYNIGGGVGLYIKKNMKFSRRNDLTIMHEKIFESLFVDIHLKNNKSISIGTIYRSSNNKIEVCNNFFEYLSRILKIINQTNKACFLMGDMNFNLLDTNNPIID